VRLNLLALPLLLAYAGAVHAALGAAPSELTPAAGTARSLSQDPAATSPASFTVQVTTLEGGTTIREYVTLTGTVFAVTWAGPFMPDLKTLLGGYFDAMVAESAKSPRAGRSQLTLRRPDLVIISGGHMRAFEGRAYLPAAFPAGFSAADIR
jgi:hypothetical protein